VTRDRLYLHHILDALKKIENYVAVGRTVFLAATHWQDAVIRQLQIVGEATKRLSPSLCASHPEVPWRRIAGLRDVLIHDYMGVDINAVWEITQKEIPVLKNNIQIILTIIEDD